MGRWILSPLLIGALLFGQSFCCCTFSALNAAVDRSDETESTSSCCCHSSGSSTDSCPDSSNAPAHDCPCKRGKVTSANLVDQVIVSVSNPHGWTRAFAVVAETRRPLVVETTGSLATCIRPSAFPRLDGVGILRAVCVLRC